MTTYRAYGISIASEVPLPPLPVADGEPEVSIRTGRVTSPRPDVRPGMTTFRGGAEEAVLATPGLAFVQLRHGREIIVEPVGEASEDAIRAIVLGPVLAVMLSQRGLMTLHASAIAVNGQAVAFMGDAGWGKSTLAAAFIRRGRPLVADDVVAVSFEQREPRVPPAVPQVRLTPEALDALGDDPARFPTVWEGTQKRARPVEIAGEPPVLSRVYVLAPEVRAQIAPIPASEATIEFVRHSYAVRSLHQTAPARYLGQAGQLARTVRVLRLGRPGQLRDVHELADAIEQDLGVAS
jgi:HPr Serine kinase C-terminal domain